MHVRLTQKLRRPQGVPARQGHLPWCQMSVSNGRCICCCCCQEVREVINGQKGRFYIYKKHIKNINGSAVAAQNKTKTMVPSDTIVRILVAALVALGGNLHVASVWVNHKSERQLACEGHDAHSPFWVLIGAVPLCLCLFPLTMERYSARARGLWVVHLLIVLSAAAVGILCHNRSA